MMIRRTCATLLAAHAQPRAEKGRALAAQAPQPAGPPAAPEQGTTSVTQAPVAPTGVTPAAPAGSPARPAAPANALELTDHDAGRVVRLDEGRPVRIALPSNRSTPFRWEVAATDRSFGYPTSTCYTPEARSASRLGMGGTTAFTWNPSPLLVRAGGTHTVTLVQRHVADPSQEARRLTYTFHIVSRPQVIDASQAGRTVDVPKGTDFVIRLRGNESTPYHWGITAVSRSLGQPTVTYVPDAHRAGLVGVGGTKEFRFSTEGPLTHPGDVLEINLAEAHVADGSDRAQELRFRIRVV